MHRRGNVTWPEFWRKYCYKDIEKLLTLMLAALLVSLLGFVLYSGSDLAMDEKRSVALVIRTANEPVERQKLADSLLHEADELLNFDATKEFLEEIKKTGKAIPVTEKSVTWGGDYFGEWLPIIGGLSLAGLLLLIVFNLTIESFKRREYILDLPWRKPWVWVFVLATLFPGVLFYPFSIIRMIQGRRQAPPEQEYTPPTAESIRDRVSFKHLPESARRAYCLVRLGDYGSDLEHERDRLTQRIELLTASLASLARQMKTAREEKGDKLAALEIVTSKLAAPPEQKPEERDIHAEFDKIMQLPGVVGVQAEGNVISVLVHATLLYGTDTYFQGDWVVKFGPSYGIRMHCLQTGVVSRWEYGQHPDYRDNRGEYTFCMGKRQSTIVTFAERGRYLEALEVLINCFNSANPQDEYLIPTVYRKDDGA